MDKEIIEEVQEIAQNASQGIWLPAVTVAALLGLVIVLLIFIHNLQQKRHNERHESHEEAIKEISTNNILLDKIVTTHEEKLKSHEKLIELKG